MTAVTSHGNKGRVLGRSIFGVSCESPRKVELCVADSLREIKPMGWKKQKRAPS